VTAAEIDALAASWVARADRGALSAEEQRQLDAWLEQDGRHLGAYVRAEASWQALDRARALASPDVEQVAPPPFLSRRRAIAAGVAAVVGTGGSLWLGSRGSLIKAGQRVATTHKQIETIALSDGSKTIINAESALRVTFDSRRRFVQLEEGEGWFEVAKDAARPFIVRAADVEARAVGTAFAVARLDDGIHVTVTEGLVEVSGPKGIARIAANSRALVNSSGEMTVTPLTPAVLDKTLAWREARIIFDGEPLSEAVARFNRFNDIQIAIHGDSLAREAVVGTFDIRSPEDFAQAVAEGFDAQLRRNGHRITIATSF
jgi:transmembrane sensor